ncbi:Stress responsive alpha-beta barrel-containing protein [Dioscorea alata]|uniref:Stress-response A/B barrel domain-containing protein At5g22580-like n=2 Tax=Dioscorea TaxID=4672 RepID=A0AB40B616_DIOCR|nr:stress-response A/B barrel domain-containing protein At5g22580-like [Dioscorea cayenensis subsp. rotundata]XP_039122745.1 LOW QUALITY PROTEIN: stress-response A/B barrel domain-containing protein At5g22580-like [Dioscorea cayenensis subsp. rotundata]KAH7685632.1 Stress responsive alpha-beta barrel-containing protein [Dioscorea alata]
MGEVKHLVLVKFKEGIVVEELLEGMKKLATEIDAVKGFEWGEDVGSEQMMSQGFTHAFILTFNCAEDFAAYSNHPSHVAFAGPFAAAIDKILLFQFPPVVIKPSA